MSAFWLARAEIVDAIRYGDYARAAGEAGAKLFDGARILARGPVACTLEGDGRFDRQVLIQFPDIAAACGFHASPDYQAAAAIRLGGAGINELVIVPGLEDRG